MIFRFVESVLLSLPLLTLARLLPEPNRYQHQTSTVFSQLQQCQIILHSQALKELTVR
jgi:hypothetical protein